jgi:predicted nucleic acid-binding protein
MLYLDASAVAPLFVPDDHSSIMQAWGSGETQPLVISDFAAAEFASVVSRAYRARVLTTRNVATVLADFDQWRSRSATIRLTRSTDIAECEKLVRKVELKLSAPDALHLAIAIADQLTLVTLDRRLADAARIVKRPVVVPGP